jgi:replicative DNA helicase
MEESFDSRVPLSVKLNGRPPPHSQEAEEFLLSCIFIDGVYALSKCMDGKITPECFYIPANRLVYQTFLWLFKNNRDLSLEVMYEELKRVNKLEEIGGIAYLTQISGRSSTSAQLMFFVETVREAYVQRELIVSASTVVEMAYDRNAEVEKFTCEINRILSIRNGTQMIKTLAQASEELLGLIERIEKGEATEEDMGISWPWKQMTDKFGTLLPGELIVVAARPGCGKSTLARHCALHLGYKKEENVLLFSREMPIEQIASLFGQMLSRLSWRLLRLGRMHPKDIADFKAAVKLVRNHRNIHIFDKDKTASQIMARSQAFAQLKPVKCLLVDYLQAYNMEQTKQETRDVAIGRFTRGLKDLAIDLKIPVLLCAQVSRAFAREDREPRNDDLRESGNIEQDADTIIFLHAPKTNPHTGMDQDINDGDVESIMVRATMTKGRNNGNNRFDFMMHRPTTIFTPLEIVANMQRPQPSPRGAK